MGYMSVGCPGPCVSIPFDNTSVANKELIGVYIWQMHYLNPVVL